MCVCVCIQIHTHTQTYIYVKTHINMKDGSARYSFYIYTYINTYKTHKNCKGGSDFDWQLEHC